MRSGRVHKTVDDLLKQCWFAHREQPRRRLIVRSSSRDQIGRNRPGRTTEADQSGFPGQCGSRLRNRLIDTRDDRRIEYLGKLRKVRFIGNRFKPWTFALFEPEFRAERVRSKYRRR